MIDGNDTAPDEQVLVLPGAEYARLLEELDEVPKVSPQLLKALQRTKKRRRSW